MAFMNPEMIGMYLMSLGLTGYVGCKILSLIDDNAERYAERFVLWTKINTQITDEERQTIGVCKKNCLGYRLKSSCRHM